ncbi:hypothetical protein [Arenimonas oryziterrae]|uniref:Uncharacterized protein n=1 Tax=Arenimonas oryziterrae DSM 21050 = YC6267 TaxID=1121015 RepID=A0A091BFC2_9GAMM|nr:hypothetical protein [Arenimonas oryziterrae]KFN43075.1 hypothetical protein N789_10965 [Arenimonas oryziterrae DSM 21050 = YC6267]
MNPQEEQRHQRLQADAERAEREARAPGDVEVDAYRLVWRALQRPLPPALPADFAAQVARRRPVREDASVLEEGLTMLMWVSMAAGAIYFALPPLSAWFAELWRLPLMHAMPWPLLLSLAISLFAVWGFGASERRVPHF